MLFIQIRVFPVNFGWLKYHTDLANCGPVHENAFLVKITGYHRIVTK